MKKTAVIYWSGTGNTEAMSADGTADTGAALEAVALGCPAMGAEELEETEFAPMFDGIKSALAGKAAALFGSYGWGDGEWMRTWEEDCASAGIRLAADSVTCCEAPDDEALAACRALGRSRLPGSRSGIRTRTGGTRRAFMPWSTSISLRCAGDTGTMSVRTCSARIRISGSSGSSKRPFRS